MSFGQNLLFLRKMKNNMIQEELADCLNVSRQTVSKWELDAAYPEMEKLLALCGLFSCSLDQLVREDMNLTNEAFSNIRIEEVESFRYISYTVISPEPEDDATGHVKRWARQIGIGNPRIIGWDFPAVSQEQRNVHHMHGYGAALVLEEGISEEGLPAEVKRQDRQRYIAITIKSPFTAPFDLIPNAYKVLMAYMNTNGLKGKWNGHMLDCFEKVYDLDGVCYMDVYIAIEQGQAERTWPRSRPEELLP